MKNYIFLLLVLALCSCTAKTPEAMQEGTITQTVGDMQVQVAAAESISAQKAIPLFGELLSDVSTSSSSFNPDKNGTVDLNFFLSHQAKVTVQVFDPDWGLIRTLVSARDFNSGTHSTSWDGLDQSGNVVPDETYFFTILAEDQSGKKEIYDPVTFSGGVSHDIVNVDIDQESHTLHYRMPEMGRVLIRVGIQGGPLMNTVVDWQPRVKGAITEYWDGKDKDGLVDLSANRMSKMIVTYFSLPETSVIAYGNKKTDYREYKRQQGGNVTLKPDRGVLQENVSHHYRLPRLIDHTPSLMVSFSNPADEQCGVITLKDKSIVHVDLVDEDKEIFKNQQFEIAFFLDQTFYAEDEVGYTPFNWVWDLSNVSEGEHLLTVNVSGFRDQIGVLSQRVMVVK